MRKFFSIQALLWLALALALVGSLRHVAHTFASIDANTTWGWVQAVAVDVGLFALALAITQRRRAKRRTWTLWLGVVIFSLISIYANLAYGLMFTLKFSPSWLKFSKPWILAATLPLLVLYLAEIVGSDIQHLLAEAEREQKRLERQQRATECQRIEAEVQRQSTEELLKNQKVRELITYFQQNPVASQADAANAVERSPSWVSATLKSLEEAGIVSRNGEGVKVLEME
jgi:hypothetical protein